MGKFSRAPKSGDTEGLLGPSYFTRLQPVRPVQNKICVCLDKRDTHSDKLSDSDCIIHNLMGP